MGAVGSAIADDDGPADDDTTIDVPVGAVGEAAAHERSKTGTETRSDRTHHRVPRAAEVPFGNNLFSDGEYVSFDTIGAPTHHLDNDTLFDGMSSDNVMPNDLERGGMVRSMLCCNAACEP